MAADQNHDKHVLDVCIVGAGFSGMNLARLLGEYNQKRSENKLNDNHSSIYIDFQLFNSSMGASGFWAGSVDVMHSKKIILAESFEEFKNRVPSNPYGMLNYDSARDALIEFDSKFPKISIFKNAENPPRIINQRIITILGKTKYSTGAWSSIFSNFEELNNESCIALINFIEFNNSSMHLVSNGLAESTGGKYPVVDISLRECYEMLETDKDPQKFLQHLSEYKIGRFLDDNCKNMEELAMMLQNKLNGQYPEISSVDAWFFPPILGDKKSVQCIKYLAEGLKDPVFEIAAPSPSLPARRLTYLFTQMLKQYDIEINRGMTLIRLERIKNEAFSRGMGWRAIFEDKDNNQKRVLTDKVVIAVGSLFLDGLFSSAQFLPAKISDWNLSEPYKFTPNMEFSANSGLFVCGSAVYNFIEGFSDEDEIRCKTGLGLSIITSHAVSKALIKKIR